jgi:hypothetical protein
LQWRFGGHSRRIGHNRAAMDQSFLSAFVLLLVLDPSTCRFSFHHAQRAARTTQLGAAREISIAYAVLFAFLFFGDAFLCDGSLARRTAAVRSHPQVAWRFRRLGAPRKIGFVTGGRVSPVDGMARRSPYGDRRHRA